MRKLKKFLISENASTLSPEEMRQISGGTGDVECKATACYHYYVKKAASLTGEHKYGSCVPYNGSCGCQFSDGSIIVPEDPKLNGCIKSS